MFTWHLHANLLTALLCQLFGERERYFNLLRIAAKINDKKQRTQLYATIERSWFMRLESLAIQSEMYSGLLHAMKTKYYNYSDTHTQNIILEGNPLYAHDSP